MKWVGAVLVCAIVGVAMLRSRSPHPPARSRPGPAAIAGQPPTATDASVRTDAAMHGATDAVAAPGRPLPADAGPPHAMTPAERTLFAPLTEGSTLGPATVVHMEGLRNGMLTVSARVGTVTQTFRIARAEGSPIALHPVGPYTLYMLDGGAGWGRSIIEPTWRALDNVLRTHLDLPVPAGLLPPSEPPTTTIRVDWTL